MCVPCGGMQGWCQGFLHKRWSCLPGKKIQIVLGLARATPCNQTEFAELQSLCFFYCFNPFDFLLLQGWVGWGYGVWLVKLRSICLFRELYLHGCRMKQTITRSGHSNADAVYLTSSGAALLSVLGFCLGAAGCYQCWTPQRCLLGAQNTPSLPSHFPGSREASLWCQHHHCPGMAMDSFQLPSWRVVFIPDLLPPFNEWLLPCRDGVVLLQGEHSTGLYEYSTQHLCLILPNSALSYW